MYLLGVLSLIFCAFFCQRQSFAFARGDHPVPQKGNRGKEDAQATTPMPFLSFAPVPLYPLGSELKRSTCIGVCTSNKIQRRKFIGSPKATTIGSFAFFCQRQFIGDHPFSFTKFIQVVHLLYPCYPCAPKVQGVRGDRLWRKQGLPERSEGN